jgi:S-formylglutathione hydrolase FrmB
MALALTVASPAQALIVPRPFLLAKTNKRLCGQIVDHTANHGRDHRIFSCALKEKRDLYVYLPPGFDPKKRYPLGIYLHGFLEDEKSFLDNVIEHLDQAMAQGKLAPMIIAAPDASPNGVSCVFSGTFYLNSNLGAFEDFLVHDVYDFLMQTYPLRPEAEAHALLGASMGGMAAFAKVMKFRDKFGVATAFAPPLNLRWTSCRDRYFDNFDPCCWKWREDFKRRNEVVGKFLGGLVKVHIHRLTDPLYGRRNPEVTERVSSENPIELLDSLDIKPGFAEFYVGYGSEDQFNLDAQIESFLHRAREKGIEVGAVRLEGGRHSIRTALQLFPGMIEWLAVRMEPYRPR